MDRDRAAFRQRFKAYKDGKSVKEIYDAGYIKEPVITPDTQYNEYINSLPDNQRLTPESLYRSHRYWELNGKPKNFSQAVQRGMFTMQADGWHANSVAENTETGELEFMKPWNHPTVKKEYDWYKSPEASQFRRDYKLAGSLPYDKYIPKHADGKLPGYKDGLPAYNTGKLPKKGRFTKQQEETLSSIYNTFKALGYDDNSIFGILGNALTESSLNGDSISLSKLYHGLLQNSVPIKKAIVNKYGDYSLKNQMKYVHDWVSGADWVKKNADTTTYNGRYKMSGYKTASEAADAFTRLYERPVILDNAGNVTGYRKADERMANAELIALYFANKNGIKTTTLPDGNKRVTISPSMYQVPEYKSTWLPAQPINTDYPLSGSQAPESLSSWNAALSPSATPTIPSIQKLNNERLKAVQGAFLLPEVTVLGNRRTSLLPKMPSLNDALMAYSPLNQMNRAMSEMMGLDDLWEDFDVTSDLFKAKNGKLPRYGEGKIDLKHNPTNATVNDDGTFTDDYTKLFEDFYVTPSGVKTKYGSYTDKNWNRYKQQQQFVSMRDSNGNLRGEKGLEIVSPEFDIISGVRGILNSFPIKTENIDLDKIRNAAAKLKMEDDAWRLAHPEYELENVLKKPQLSTDLSGEFLKHPELIQKPLLNIIRQPSRDLNTRMVDGFIERFALKHEGYTDDVVNAYKNQIIPRRACAYSAEQLTDGVIKINKYLEENGLGEIDFSTPNGLKIANDQGWSFDEIADYNNYKSYVSELNKYKTGAWQEYEERAWDMRYPVNKETGGRVVGDYDVTKDRIRTLGKTPLLHESRHRMDNYMPLLDREKKALMDAYSLPGNSVRNTIINKDELVTTNSELRNALLKLNGAENMSLKTQLRLLNNPKMISDETILGELEYTNNYGKSIVEHIRSRLLLYELALSRTALPREERIRRLAEKKTEYVDNIRNALMYVGGGALAIKPVTKQTTE